MVYTPYRKRFFDQLEVGNKLHDAIFVTSPVAVMLQTQLSLTENPNQRAWACVKDFATGRSLQPR